MAYVRLKGLNSVRKRLADGREVRHWYAWKGGPKIDLGTAPTALPGSPEFMTAYNAAVATSRPQPKDTLAGLVGRYRASPEFTGLEASTRTAWGRWLARIEADEGPLDIGGLTLKALDDRRVRADLLDWRDQWAGTPRAADYAMQVLGRVLSWALDRGLVTINAAAGVSQLWESNRADQIWTAEEISRFVAAAPSPEAAFALRLAALTGMRCGDLTRLAWSHVGELAIVMPTGKSRGRKVITVPLLAETRALLKEIRARQLARHDELKVTRGAQRKPPPVIPTTVLSNTRGGPWTAGGLSHLITDTSAAAAPAITKHLHDTRGSFGTRLRKAGLKASQIADILGWEEKRVERLLATYVDNAAIIMDLAAQIARSEEAPAGA